MVMKGDDARARARIGGASARAGGEAHPRPPRAAACGAGAPPTRRQRRRPSRAPGAERRWPEAALRADPAPAEGGQKGFLAGVIDRRRWAGTDGG